ncbi:NAD(P)/FAD-dependent oxidoreductase [Paenalkalicoccus suaedae]|uniref:NAD(P)/FAD-dependent oxidoreductase n=1 Tax=Paenalkalicoccus suaedae TaxID=2592382 RepID=A0A859FA60_9BACI|nr:NAD(P)/FAD-dependent oxidoreductase [Paenalkalicoccus suaedae]QKS69787.1 NAD(P)/FAD-dependent oxidoreductase [Paenalkalicoccus suaedae]
MYTYLVIGGGVIGTFIARELSHHEGEVLLVEKEDALAQVQTKHNSALVHPALMAPPDKGELKSSLAREGNELYHELLKHWDIPVVRHGALLLARSEDEVESLREHLKAGENRGITDTLFLSKEEVKKREPKLCDSVAAGLLMPSAMSANTKALTDMLAQNARLNGADIRKGVEVAAIESLGEGAGFRVKSTEGEEFETKYIINAAGIACEKIAGLVESEVPYKTEPNRGEYVVLGPEAKDFVHHIIYPLPTKKSKGVLLIPQPDGTLRLGPTSTDQRSTTDAPVTEEGKASIKNDIDRLVKGVPLQYISHTYAGIRSTIDYGDFYIKPSNEVDGFIHVAGIESPGVTSAPAIARYVVHEVLGKLTKVERKAQVKEFELE